MTIDVSKNVLIPIIGVNECGKTTILQAMFAFDHFNDDLNDDGRHRRDTDNLYATRPKAATVSAEVEVPRRELLLKLSQLQVTPPLRAVAESYRRKRGVPTTFVIERNVKTGVYDINVTSFTNKDLNNMLGRSLVNALPYTLYFDDFRDSVGEKVEIVRDSDGGISGWLEMFQQLFKKTDRRFSVFDLAGMEERQRKTVLSAVKRKLNETLTREWHNFRLDTGDALQISVDFYQGNTSGASRDYLRLDVIEKDPQGNEHFFYINDRSKGFFWFFNFVMKLEFNPKVFEFSQTNAIYLLDEPGSYLHAAAQSKLCTKLRQLSQHNAVIYCTHSHYLLDPNIIPLSSIRVAEKTSNGEVRLISIHEHKGDVLERRSAFQPVVDALQIKPFLLDLTASFVVLVEGISDFYALEMFKGNRTINILPSVGADSILYYISLMIAWRIEYRALWDSDAAGLKSMARAEEKFGEIEAAGRFFALPLPSGTKSRILQNLFDGSDLVMIRTRLEIPPTTSFDKTVATLFYSSKRSEILNEIGSQTRAEFEKLFDWLRLG